MNTPLTPQSLVEQILQIQQMEHGSLSVLGQGPNGPHYNLNSWENGKNHCRYIPREKVQQVQQALEGFHRYEQLTEQYAQQVVEKTRAQMDIGIKKKPRPRPSRSFPSRWPKNRKSSS
jgi:hypothetical protein